MQNETVIDCNCSLSLKKQCWLAVLDNHHQQIDSSIQANALATTVKSANVVSLSNGLIIHLYRLGLQTDIYLFDTSGNLMGLFTVLRSSSFLLGLSVSGFATVATFPYPPPPPTHLPVHSQSQIS